MSKNDLPLSFLMMICTRKMLSCVDNRKHGSIGATIGKRDGRSSRSGSAQGTRADTHAMQEVECFCPARGARRSAGKSIRLPAWRACPREFPERSHFSNYAHPVYLSWPRWSHPFCGLQSEAHEGDNRNSASFPGSRTGLVEVTCCRCYIHCACVGTFCMSWPFLSAQRLCKTVGNFLFLLIKPVKDLQVEFCQRLRLVLTRKVAHR